jgi:hypothetical protein
MSAEAIDRGRRRPFAERSPMVEACRHEAVAKSSCGCLAQDSR